MRVQVAIGCQASEACAVVRGVVYAPTGVDRVEIRRAHQRLKQWVRTIDPRIEEADARHFIGVRRKLKPRCEVGGPLALFWNGEADKKRCRVFGATQLRHAIQQQDRLSKVPLRAIHHDDRALRELNDGIAH